MRKPAAAPPEEDTPPTPPSDCACGHKRQSIGIRLDGAVVQRCDKCGRSVTLKMGAGRE